MQHVIAIFLYQLISSVIKGGVDHIFCCCLNEKNFVCFIVFLYMSAGCVSTFRTCVQGYLEWLPFVFASDLHFTLC